MWRGSVPVACMIGFRLKFGNGYRKTCGSRSPGRSRDGFTLKLFSAATSEITRASHRQGMKGRFQVFVLMLVLPLAADSFMLHAQPLLTAPDQSSAGCHQHGHKTPGPQSQSFVCCLSGHDFAIVQSSSAVAPATSGRLHSSDLVGETVVALFPPQDSQQLISSGDPPAASPLRI